MTAAPVRRVRLLRPGRRIVCRTPVPLTLVSPAKSAVRVNAPRARPAVRRHNDLRILRPSRTPRRVVYRTGVPGLSGEKGDKGDKGDQGDPGAPGLGLPEIFIDAAVAPPYAALNLKSATIDGQPGFFLEGNLP